SRGRSSDRGTTRNLWLSAHPPDISQEKAFMLLGPRRSGKGTMARMMGTLGAPAVAFVQRHRHDLFAATPMVFTAVEQGRIRYSTLSENDTVVAVANSFPAVFENILRVLPDTKTVAVVDGNSPNEKFWLEEIRRDARRFANRITFTWYNELS